MKKQAATEKKGMSPYVKYAKRPFIYSDELNNWTAAVKAGHRDRANHFDRLWKKKFGVSERPQQQNTYEDFYAEDAHAINNYR